MLNISIVEVEKIKSKILCIILFSFLIFNVFFIYNCGADNLPIAHFDQVYYNTNNENDQIYFGDGYEDKNFEISAYGTDSNGNLPNSMACFFRSDLDGELDTGGSGQYYGNLSPGTHTIYLTVMDGNYRCSEEISMKVINPPDIPVAYIDRCPERTLSSAEFELNGHGGFKLTQKIELDGHAVGGLIGQVTNDDGTTKDFRDIVYYCQWRSSIDGVLFEGTCLHSFDYYVTKELSVGTHTIYFKVRDVNGRWSEEVSRTLEVISDEQFAEQILSDGHPSNQNEQPTNNIPNKTPIADANGPYQGVIRNSITFDGSASKDSDGNIASYSWNFGDASTGIGKTTTHIYKKVGNYTVTLTVTDNNGETDTDITYVIIEPAKPTVYGPITGNKNIKYVYEAWTAIPQDVNNPIRYVFDWEDGTNTTSIFLIGGTNATHSWTSPGNYTVKVYAEDKNNISSETTELTVSIDVKAIYTSGENYLVDDNSDGTYDRFHNTTSGIYTSVEEKNGIYTIDDNGDGSWDYTYDSAAGTASVFEEKSKTDLNLVVITIIVLIPLLFGIAFWKYVTSRHKDKKTWNKKEAKRKNSTFDADTKIVLCTMDELLIKLPDNVINDFVKTKEFSLYEKVVHSAKNNETIDTIADEDVRKVILSLNALLDNLPDKVINNFAKTKEFSTYEKVMRKYKIK